MCAVFTLELRPQSLAAELAHSPCLPTPPLALLSPFSFIYLSYCLPCLFLASFFCPITFFHSIFCVVLPASLFLPLVTGLLEGEKNTHIRVPAHPVTFLSRRASLFPHPDTLGLPLLDPIHLFPSVSPLYLPSLPSTLLTASLESR